jgi:phage terminase large subunit-like protein
LNDSLKKLLDLDAIRAERARRKRRKIDTYFPDAGAHRRELYPKHLEFFKAGAEHKERAFVAGNRCGKTIAGAYEVTLHLTGQYPPWWEGRRFACPTDIWAAGDTNKTVRDIITHELLGPANERGTGMIPGDLILDINTARGVADSVDTVLVKHVSGGTSTLGFKTYSEGRHSWQGSSRHCIWVDEECPMDVYLEALVRTMIVPGDERGGICLLTFTPLNGFTELVSSFLDRE